MEAVYFDTSTVGAGIHHGEMGGLRCRTHQRSTYQERIVQAHLTALAESGTPVKDQADQATANPRALPRDSAQIER